ncbi:MAG TPA: LptE family protein [Chthoniobacterales bacterium]|nr:LptE family protein [Chthoniobacterales bacterium]
MRTFPCVLLLALSLSGCAGYHIGSVKPRYLADVQSIAVPTFHNKTFLPRIEVLATNTVIKQLQQDGTYRIRNEGDADAVLHATIEAVNRTPARSVRGNVLATTEFNLTVRVIYTLEGRDGKRLAGPIGVIGDTSFFVGSDVTTEEQQALPLAVEELAVRMASQLSEGW